MKKTKILVVDDNIANLQLVVSVLNKFDYDVSIAENGDMALDMLEYIDPELILLDIMMPGIDGFQVCSEIKKLERFQNTPVIFLTALNNSESLVKGFNHGAVDYIFKPFNRQELIARVNNHIELKRSKDTIITQNSELSKLNEEVDSLLRITAHDLKNPLQGILGLMDIAEIMTQEESPDMQVIIDIIQTAKNAASQADRIIKDILDLNRIEKGAIKVNKSKVNLNHLLTELENNYKMKAMNKNIKLIINSIDNSIFCITDADKLMRIFDNLLSNAVKFSEHGKTVIVDYTFNENDNSIKINFTDEGPGIKDEETHLLFTKFAVISNTPTGDESSSGLGLNIVKTFADLLKYEIEYQTKLNIGTCFSIIINELIYDNNQEVKFD